MVTVLVVTLKIRVNNRISFSMRGGSYYKQGKLKRKLRTDSQLVGIAKEELEMKKCLVDQMDRMDRQYQDGMTQLS